MEFYRRLQKIVPAHVQPAFRNVDEMKAFHKRESERTGREVYDQYQQTKVQQAIGRCGIKKKHLKCSFDNYYTECQQQRHAFNAAQTLFNDYRKGGYRSFIFSGLVGTGKNHLACAIANGLLALKKSVVVITVSDLMAQLRNSYNSETKITESQIIKYLSSVDLLILDEVGVQRQNAQEDIMLTQIIDIRYTNDKPTGILTNLANQELIQCLGERNVDRIMENGDWVAFTWQSYRKTHRKVVGKVA